MLDELPDPGPPFVGAIPLRITAPFRTTIKPAIFKALTFKDRAIIGPVSILSWSTKNERI
jgi:hypothetical protein